MNYKKFQETYNLAPYELYEFAEGAMDVTNCPELKEAGKAFLDAKKHFEKILEKHGIEIG